jgi:peptidyl-tRNA hydrolase
VVSYFDENEVCPITLSVQNLSKEQVFDRMLTGIGQPHNYGLTQEQLLEIKKKEEDEKVRIIVLYLH